MNIYKEIITIVLLGLTFSANAGLFLDLDMGAHLTNYHEHQPDGTRWLGNDNPIGIIRVGYQTDRYNFTGQLNISAHSYYEHMSSAGTGDDTGVDVLMFGIRIE